jgi:hypothetical protein
MKSTKKLLLVMWGICACIVSHTMLGKAGISKKQHPNASASKKNEAFDAYLCAKIVNAALTQKNHRPASPDIEEDDDLSDQTDWVSLFRQTASFIFLQGNSIRIDQVYGSDLRGSRNGTPFATINAALNAAFSGDTVRIFPGTYNESFTIPNGVSILGIDLASVIISLNTTTATDLITMGENTRLENVTLSLTSSNHVQLRGIVFPGTTSTTAKVRTIVLTVNNSGAGAGTSNVYGVHSTGTGTPAQQTSALRASTVTVNSTGAGSKRGILVSTANNYHIRDSNVVVTNSGTGSAIGVETNNASAAFSAHTSTISGTNSNTPTAAADISQTLGSITIATTDLINANANGLGFSTAVSPTIITWADAGLLSAGTNFMHVGTSSPGNQMFVRCPQPLIVKSLSVQTATAPGSTDTWTVFKNGVSTGLAVSLTTPSTSNVNNSQSVSFATGDRISLQVVRGASGSSETNVTMLLY